MQPFITPGQSGAPMMAPSRPSPVGMQDPNAPFVPPPAEPSMMPGGNPMMGGGGASGLEGIDPQLLQALMMQAVQRRMAEQQGMNALAPQPPQGGMIPAPPM